MADKTLGNENVAQAKVATPDLKVYGDGDLWVCLCKASSQSEGWMKSTKALEIEFLGVLVQVTTHQRNYDGTNAVAEAVVFVRGAQLIPSAAGWALRRLD